MAVLFPDTLSHQGAGEHHLTFTHSAFLSGFARGLCPARASQMLEPVSPALLETNSPGTSRGSALGWALSSPCRHTSRPGLGRWRQHLPTSARAIAPRDGVRLVQEGRKGEAGDGPGFGGAGPSPALLFLSLLKLQLNEKFPGQKTKSAVRLWHSQSAREGSRAGSGAKGGSGWTCRKPASWLLCHLQAGTRCLGGRSPLERGDRGSSSRNSPPVGRRRARSVLPGSAGEHALHRNKQFIWYLPALLSLPT